MPYTSVSDVKALAPSVQMSSTSQPPESTVAAWIADYEKILNVSLAGMGYVTPITGDQSLAIVRRIVSHAIMAMVMRARPNPEQNPDNFQAIADADLKALRDPMNPLSLADASKLLTIIKNENTIRISSNFADIARDPDNLISVTRDKVF